MAKKLDRGRPSKLTDRQWGDIGLRLTNGESVRALAREYKVDPSAISRRYSQQVDKLKKLATTIVTTEREVESLTQQQQHCVLSLVDQMRGIQANYAKAAANGAMTAAKLTEVAQRKALAITDDVREDELRPIAALHATANRALQPASQLIAANKGKQDDDKGKGNAVRFTREDEEL